MPKSSVSLPDLPWEHDAALARPEIEVERVQDPENPKAMTYAWRREVPPVLRAMPLDIRRAFEAYALAVEAVGASVGTMDPTGGGGSRVAPTGPSLARLNAAARLTAMDNAIGAGQVKIRRSPAKWMPCRDLVRAVAVDGLPAVEAIRLGGLADPTRADVGRAVSALRTAGVRLSEFLNGGR